TKSPTSLSIAFEQMRRGAALTFEEAMKVEFRIVSRIPEGHDFYEGVRATLIDKDGRPRWDPSTLEGLRSAAIDAYFAELGDDDLLRGHRSRCLGGALDGEHLGRGAVAACGDEPPHPGRVLSTYSGKWRSDVDLLLGSRHRVPCDLLARGQRRIKQAQSKTY